MCEQCAQILARFCQNLSFLCTPKYEKKFILKFCTIVDTVVATSRYRAGYIQIYFHKKFKIKSSRETELQTNNWNFSLHWFLIVLSETIEIPSIWVLVWILSKGISPVGCVWWFFIRRNRIFISWNGDDNVVAISSREDVKWFLGFGSDLCLSYLIINYQLVVDSIDKQN